MSDEYNDLIDAIQRIAWAESRYQTSALHAALKRGTLPAETARGSVAIDECCTDSAESNTGSTSDGSESTDVSDGIPSDGDFGDHLERLDGLHDCETGQDVSLNLSGTFEAPEGWDSLTEGPIDDTWEEGYYWRAGYLYTWTDPQYSYSAMSAMYKKLEDAKSSWYDVTVESISENTDGTHYYTMKFTYRPFEDWAKDTQYIRAYKNECDGSYPEYCDITAEDTRPTEWPSDGVAQVSLIDGVFVSNTMDPDGSDYLYPSHDMYLCDDDGQMVRVVADKYGGYMTIPTDPSTGEPLSDSVISRYDSNGDRKGTISADEVKFYELPDTID